MSGSIIFYYTSRGTVYYSPTDYRAEKTRSVRLPAPPCRPRARRPHSIHITRLPAGFVPYDLRPQAPSPEPRNPSKFRVELRKLATRENAKRVLDTVFSPFSPTFSTASSSEASPVAPAAREATSTPSAPIQSPPYSPHIPRSVGSSLSLASGDASTILARRIASGISAPTTPITTAMSRPSLSSESGRVNSPRNSISTGSTFSAASTTKSATDGDKPVCSGNGVTCNIILAEPVIFLTGLDHDGTTRDSSSNAAGSLLRGRLVLNVTKSAKIKTVTIKFTGRARTEWPEGIPPEKTALYEEESLRTAVIPFFNATYEGSETGYGTHCTYVLRDKTGNGSTNSMSNSDSNGAFSLPIIGNRSSRSSTMLSGKDAKRLSLQSAQSRSFQKGDSPCGPTPQQKGYKVFHPGVYEYAFETLIDNNSPETTKLPLASVIWQLEVLVERAGTFKPNLQGFKEVPVVRSPSEDSLELVEPISISRRWEDQLHYEIMISGKSFPLGSKIPIAFKLTPLAKVQVHKLKVYVSENFEYFAKDRKVTRRDITRKILLIEKSAGKPLAKEYYPSEVRVLRGGEPTPEEREQRRAVATRQREREARVRGTAPVPLPDVTENMLGDLDLNMEQFLGQTEIEMNVQLPTCEMMEKDRTKRMAHDCTWKNVDVHHWIKIVMRISRVDADNPAKRRHFEISIDSPISILNCRATQANLALPEYSDMDAETLSQQRVCGCPNAAVTNDSPASSTSSIPTLDSMHLNGAGHGEVAMPDLARPPQAHLSTNAAVQRPIHMLRAPSFNPPAFDADEPPPPIATPPPLYDNVIGTPSHDGLADYFARLSDFEDEQVDTDDEDSNRAYNRGRVNVVNPRTPGGRIARSMDIDRNFMFNSEAFNTLNGQSGPQPGVHV